MEEGCRSSGGGQRLADGRGGETFVQKPVRPELDTTERAISVAIFAVTLAYLWLFRRYTFLEPDEGIVLQGAQRILQGEVLYRDFFSYFTPGSYYFLALLFRVFGSSFLVGRTALVFFGGIYSVISYLLARRVCSRGTALWVAALVAFITIPYRFEVLHNWDSTLWCCLAVYCAVRWLESSQLEPLPWKWAFATGSFASLTFLFEQSKGTGLILGLGAGFVAIAVLDRGRSVWKGTQGLGVAAGMAWPFVATFAYFGAQHSLSLMRADWFWPLYHYTLANRVPYGYQNWSENARQQLFGTGSIGVRLITIVTVSPCFLVPALPLIAVGLLAYWIIQTWRRYESPEVGSYYVLICAVLSGLLLSVVVGRADVIHFMYLLPLFSLVLGWMIEGRDVPGRIFHAMRPFLIVYSAIAFLFFAMPLLLRAINTPSKVQTRRGTILTAEDDQVIPYVQAHVAPGENILVYPYLPLYYYLTDTHQRQSLRIFPTGDAHAATSPGDDRRAFIGACARDFV